MQNKRKRVYIRRIFYSLEWVISDNEFLHLHITLPYSDSEFMCMCLARGHEMLLLQEVCYSIACFSLNQQPCKFCVQILSIYISL